MPVFLIPVAVVGYKIWEHKMANKREEEEEPLVALQRQEDVLEDKEVAVFRDISQEQQQQRMGDDDDTKSSSYQTLLTSPSTSTLEDDEEEQLRMVSEETGDSRKNVSENKPASYVALGQVPVPEKRDNLFRQLRVTPTRRVQSVLDETLTAMGHGGTNRNVNGQQQQQRAEGPLKGIRGVISNIRQKHQQNVARREMLAKNVPMPKISFK